MSTINSTHRPAPFIPPHNPVSDAGLSELIAQEQFSKDLKSKKLSESVILDTIAANQVLRNTGGRTPASGEFAIEINAYPPSESDWQDFVAATLMVSDEVRNDLIFDPAAWEKHANVLVAAIIALNVARVANAQLRGHFGVMAADAAKSQGAAIVESGKAAMYSAITAALVSGVIAGFSMVKTLQGQGLKHADINLHKRNALDAGNVERDLKIARARDDWDPETPCRLTVFDDFGRIKSVDFNPRASALNAQEQAWIDAQIIKATKVGQTSDWLSQMGSKGIEKKLEFGRALSAMSMSMSQLVSSMVRVTEHAAREKEVLQQSAQSTQKSLSDEVGQKDSADAALLQKFMDIVMQILQSRIEVIGKIV